MAKVKVKINRAAGRAFMNSAAIQQELLRRAENVAEACRSESGLAGFEADVQPGRTRAHAMVKTVGFEAVGHDAKHGTLLNNFDRFGT